MSSAALPKTTARTRKADATSTAAAAPRPSARELAAMQTLELVFFVHLQMADAADQMLAEHGLGRPHHRVLYFATREPGITVGALLSMLRITNQALARTTAQLAERGLLEQRYSAEDRRVRRNYATAEGQALVRRLTQRQIEVITRAQSRLASSEIKAMLAALAAMARPEDIAWMQATSGDAGPRA